jgi:hypothetical protein
MAYTLKARKKAVVLNQLSKDSLEGGGSSVLAGTQILVAGVLRANNTLLRKAEDLNPNTSNYKESFSKENQNYLNAIGSNYIITTRFTEYL